MRPRIAFLTLAALVATGAAFADNLQLGGSYNTFTIDENGAQVSVGGGPVMPSTLNGQALPFVYCVGLFTDVYVPADYPNTIVTQNGIADGAAIHNAGEIAWLVDNFAVAAEGSTTAQEALQAAIWTVEYNTAGPHTPVTGDSSQGYYAQYQADMTALGTNTAPVSTLDWFTPKDATTNTYQALISAVPEPTSIFLLGTAALFVAGSMKKKIGVRR